MSKRLKHFVFLVSMSYCALSTTSDRHPNPVHNIRFRWNKEENRHFIQYRFHATSQDWKPQYQLTTEEVSGHWVFDEGLKGWKALLQHVPNPMPKPPLQAHKDWQHQASVRNSIMKLNQSAFPDWSETVYREWRAFWAEYQQNIRTESIQFSLPQLFNRHLGTTALTTTAAANGNQNVLNDHSSNNNSGGQIPRNGDDVSRFKKGEDRVKESFVVGSASVGRKWALDRDEQAKLALASDKSLQLTPSAVLAGIELGDHLVIFPNEQSQLEDRQLGYNLPFSIGEVDEINSDALTLSVVWMFAEFVDEAWKRWEDDDECHGQIADLELFQHADMGGNVFKVKLTASMKLTKKSREDLEKEYDCEVWTELLKPKRGEKRILTVEPEKGTKKKKLRRTTRGSTGFDSEDDEE